MPEFAFQEGSLIAGRYRLGAQLGEGGMGEVWSAIHTVTRRSVALKFLKQSLRDKPGLRQRFLREASTASALRHPNVVEILDVFDFEERAPVLVMELLEGETLGTKLTRDGRLSMEETAALMLPVCSAVGTAHALGIVHRDIKPENIFLARTDEGTRVKVLDFGIAKLTAEHYLEGGRSALITDTGSMLGTPCYMAPEQATGEASADYRADIWSVGVILYECLSGTRPIEGENLAQVVSRLVGAGIIPLERLAPELPHEVAALVTQMLTRERARRPQSLVEISKVLSRYTMVKTPGFGPPSIGPASLAPELEPPRAKITMTNSADPRGATMLSSPPVGGSLVGEPIPRSRLRRAGPALLVALLFVVTLLALSGFGAFGRAQQPSASSSAPSPAAATNASPAPDREPPPVQPVAESVPNAGPTKTGQAASSRKLSTKTPTVKKAAARAPSPRLGEKRETDEGQLFPGRK
jgi:eukaryotic-like serine/threonine-protein kinase